MTGHETQWHASTDNLCHAVEALNKDDKIHIEDDTEILTVIKTGTTQISGNPYKTYCVWFSGDDEGRVYRLRGGQYTHGTDRPPKTDVPVLLERREDQEWVPDTQNVRSITRLNPEVQIVSSLTAEEYFRTLETAPERIPEAPLTTAPATNELKQESCPECGGRLAVDSSDYDDRIVCTECRRWCWRDDWERYYDTEAVTQSHR